QRAGRAAAAAVAVTVHDRPDGENRLVSGKVWVGIAADEVDLLGRNVIALGRVCRAPGIVGQQGAALAGVLVDPEHAVGLHAAGGVARERAVDLADGTGTLRYTLAAQKVAQADIRGACSGNGAGDMCAVIVA